MDEEIQVDSVLFVSAITSTIHPKLLRKYVLQICKSISLWLQGISTPGSFQKISKSSNKLFGAKEGVVFWISFLNSLFAPFKDENINDVSEREQPLIISHPLSLDRRWINQRRALCSPFDSKWEIQSSEVKISIPPIEPLETINLEDISPFDIITTVKKILLQLN